VVSIVVSRWMIDPVLVGRGKRLFPADGGLHAWRPAGSTVTAAGAILASCRRAAA
jgi:hypothetical protein